MDPSLPTRNSREHTDLDQLKRLAKELLEAFHAADAAAVAEVKTHDRDANPTTFALHDAQRVLARAYGFASWPKLKAYIEGITAREWMAAVRTGDLEKVRAMLRARPEVIHMWEGECCAIHYAVLNRSVEMTRLLMQHGADARAGVYPHRDATTALTMATERGYDEIVFVIHEEDRVLSASVCEKVLRPW